jgi:general secretion pathway protein J
MARRRSAFAAGFTLLELMIAMTILSMLSVALYGVISLGATSAGAGERRSEQTRRYRTAVGVMLRQLRSAAPVYVSHGDDEDEDRPAEPYFIGEKDSLEFATASPQGPNAAGLALVHYWVDDGKLMMSETPYFLAYDEDGLDDYADDLTLEAVLLYDVKDLTFEFQRSDYESEEWESDWDAADEDAMPAGIRVTIESELPTEPGLSYQIPVYVAVFNEITGEEDYSDDAGRTGVVPGEQAQPPEDTEPDEEEEEEAEDEDLDEEDEDFDEDMRVGR